MKAFIRRNTYESGFSLIEILIAVVILATGLLALTALQGRLAQASAEAKTRTRVASMLTARLEELRAGQYSNAVLNVASDGSTTTAYACTSGSPDWLCTAQTESSVTALTVSQQVSRYTSLPNVGAFTITGDVLEPGNFAIPEFKRITLTANWTDASNAPHQLSVSTDVSPLSLTGNTIPRAPNTGVGGGQAIVRQDNPAGPGVIPIAIGGGDATAASNPRPEIIGKDNNSSVVGTRFDVLTYQGLSGASVIQRRVETAAISCTCEYGAGGANLPVIYRTAQWPAEWTGERYEVIAPAGSSVAPGDVLASKSGPASGADQSPLCTECCRDHHDAAGNATLFDPVRTGGYSHYNASLTAVGVASGTKYIEACRVIRVDGFWRTASDMYAKHFGLINTSAVGGVAAKSGAPDSDAVIAYQAFVKTYLSGYALTTPPAAVADKDPDGGLATTVININAPPPADERYLHARGLYVDFLNSKAQARIKKAFDGCTTADKTECILPYLPFTTINTTELSYWEPRVSGASNSDVLTVATGSSLIFDPLQPTRGRTNAKASAANGATADSTAIITRSNAGVAVGEAVDPQDDAYEGIDKQQFRVVASGTGVTGQNFSVRLTGLPQTSDTNTSNDPAIAWTNATGNANCDATIKLNNPGKDLDPNDYACNTFGALGIATTVRFSNYFREYNVTQTMTATCEGTSATASVARPTFSNFAVSSATVGGVAALTLAVTNDGKTTESTLASFGSIPSGGLVLAAFTETEVLQASIVSCTTNGGRNQINDIVWSRPWLIP